VDCTINRQTDEGVVEAWDFIKSYWEPSDPKMIISVTSGKRHFTMTQRMLKSFKRGLIKAANATGQRYTAIMPIGDFGQFVAYVTSQALSGGANSISYRIAPHTVKKERLKVAYNVAPNERTHLRATERHLSYGITQCYLPPDRGERAPP